MQPFNDIRDTVLCTPRAHFMQFSFGYVSLCLLHEHDDNAIIFY